MPCALFKDFFTHVTNNAPRVYKKEVNFRHLEHNPRNKNNKYVYKNIHPLHSGSVQAQGTGLAAGKAPATRPSSSTIICNGKIVLFYQNPLKNKEKYALILSTRYKVVLRKV